MENIISSPWNVIGALQKFFLVYTCYAWIWIVFFDYNVLDEMGTRVEELEQSINDLRDEMGVEGSPSPSVPPKVKEEPKSADSTQV
uniref:Uncharacterized protein MANES_05G064200 n=1 Tax=Rhizophora mucronata TaxID=61149 RepID=A0A2P2K7W8_RHIMU